MSLSSSQGTKIRYFQSTKFDSWTWICIVNFSITRTISDVQKQKKQNGKWNNNVGEPSTNRRLPMWNVFELAPESPLRKSLEVPHDESSYDSFHNYETGELVDCDTQRVDTKRHRVEISDHALHSEQMGKVQSLWLFPRRASERKRPPRNLVQTCKQR